MCEDFYVYKHLIDFSWYEKENPFYDDENRKVISKMKNKLNGEIVEEFVGLRAKCIRRKQRKKK